MKGNNKNKGRHNEEIDKQIANKMKNYISFKESVKVDNERDKKMKQAVYKILDKTESELER